MGRKVYVSLLVLLCVALALAGPAAGDMKAAFTGTATGYSIDAAVRQLMSTTSTRLEDGIAPELTVDLEVHRRVLADYIRQPGLDRTRPACDPECPARGGRYTGRGCKLYEHCG